MSQGSWGRLMQLWKEMYLRGITTHLNIKITWLESEKHNLVEEKKTNLT